MSALDAETLAYIEALVADAPPLPDAVRALLVRDFTTKTPDVAWPTSDAAA